MAKPKPRATKVARKESPSLKLRKDPIAGLQAAIEGKDNYAETMRFNDEKVLGHVKNRVSTRSIALDFALQPNAQGASGLPFGRLVEVFGAEQTGKTTITDHVIAEVQSMGGVAAVLDSEFKKDRNYSEALGVDTSKLIAIEPPRKTVESVIETVRRSTQHWIDEGLQGTPLVIVVDSIAGLPTAEEMDNPTTKQPGVASRELRRAMRQLTQLVARAQCLLLVTNQQYEKIGVFSPTPGVKRSTYGGGGIRYHASIRMELIRTGTLKASNGTPVGIEVLCKIIKNQMGAPADCAFAVEWGKGVNNAWSVLERLKDHRYVTSGGGWSTFSAQGHPQFRWQGGWQGLSQAFAENPELWNLMAGIYRTLPNIPEK